MQGYAQCETSNGKTYDPRLLGGNLNANCAAKAVGNPDTISGQLDALECAVEALSTSFDGLDSRIAPFCLRHPRKENECAKNISTRSPVAETISRIRERVQSLHDRILDTSSDINFT